MKNLIASLVAAVCCISATAQTDVTENYIANAGFEDNAAECVASSSSAVTNNADGLRGWNITPRSWTATSPATALIISADCFTDNNGGRTAPHGGKYAYYQRFGWGSAASALSQTTAKDMPKGKYKLTFYAKAFAFNGASTSAVVSVSAGGKSLGNAGVACAAGSAGCMANAEWTKREIVFDIEAATPVTIKADMTWGNGGSMIAYDDFSITQLPDDYVEENPDAYKSPTEGVITHDFVPESEMMQDLLQMVANSLQYAKNIWFNCQWPNDKGEACGYFKANSAGQSNEDGVRTNADFSMLCAFVYKYGKGKVSLPEGMTWDEVKDMAVKSLVFGYSTHKANKLKVTSDQRYWGSTSASDAVWESSLWAMSLAYSTHFLKDELSEAQMGYIYNMLKAECDYELQRSVPTGYNGDTKAEENGWEVDVLAATLGLFPDDALAKQWFERMRLFAINSYSHSSDKSDKTVIDDWYDQTTVADLYKGQNLYSDYTLQNHNYFHTSYQNVVIQELGEARLALEMFQGGSGKWRSNALMHNNDRVMNDVLKWLATADGELAMPNGNDWSMFLFDQITSYTTMACFDRDPDALLLENMAYKYIKARQSTTNDGSWLLNSDIGPRRMGVEGHRVMMTYLMHLAASTADMQPTTWTDFCDRHSNAKRFTTQNIVRAASQDRFTVFSWSTGLKSYTGYIASCRPDVNKIMCPFKANNTGNILGWYTVSGKNTNAEPVTSGVYSLDGNAYTMNGVLKTNDATLQNSFALWSTPGNAVIYLDRVTALANGTITREQGGLTAVSTDPFTNTERTIYSADGKTTTDGSYQTTVNGNWANIDNQLGFVTTRSSGRMAFGDLSLSSSVHMSKLYPLYDDTQRSFKTGDEIDRRHLVYYVNVDAATTAALAAKVSSLAGNLSEGWNGVIAPDPDGTVYLIVSNLGGKRTTTSIEAFSYDGMAPVLDGCTTNISGNTSTIDKLTCTLNHSFSTTLHAFISGLENGQALMDGGTLSVTNLGKPAEMTVTMTAGGQTATTTISVEADEQLKLTQDGNTINVEHIAADNQPDRVDAINEDRAEAAIYNLSGVKQAHNSNFPKGIYITNKRKVALE